MRMMRKVCSKRTQEEGQRAPEALNHHRRFMVSDLGEDAWTAFSKGTPKEHRRNTALVLVQEPCFFGVFRCSFGITNRWLVVFINCW